MRAIQVLRMRKAAVTSPPGVGSIGALTESTSGTTVSVALPTYGIGDVVFIHYYISDAGGNVFNPSAPTGWTQVSRIASSSNTVTQIVYRRIMDGSEGSSVLLNTNGIGSNKQARAFTVGGVNTGGVVTEAVATNSGTGTTFTTGAVTTLGNNRLLLNFFGTLRGLNGSMAESADSWTDIYMTATSSMSLNPHLAATKQTAATTGTYTAETRTETDNGGILWNTISFAVIMV